MAPANLTQNRLVVGLAAVFVLAAIAAIIVAFTMREETPSAPTPTAQPETAEEATGAKAMEPEKAMGEGEMMDGAGEGMGELLTLGGRFISLEEFKGKPVVMWFIVPVGCPICAAQADDMVRAYEELGDEAVFVIVTLLNYEGVEDDVRSFMEREGLPSEWIYALDVGGLGVKFNVVEMGVIVLGPDGSVVFRGIPMADYQEIVDAVRGVS